MKHFGDITKIDGSKIPIVDIITGGSPCQDLSVAGRRAGLAGERSGLFMEQIRIFKEQRDEYIRQLRMRGADVDLRLVKPRYLIWENVPGAFSSNKGEDFRCVLEEFCRIADQTATVPMPENGKWSTSGCIVGDGWSIAWRVHNAQFWGVAQRRRRISVIGDFGSESAPEILFERKGLQGDFVEGREARESATRPPSDGFKNAITGVVGTAYDGSQVSPTLTAHNADGSQRMPDKENFNAVVQTMDVFHCTSEQDMAQTLKARDYKDPQVVTYGQGSFGNYKEGFGTLKANGGDIGGGSESLVIQ